MTEYTLYAFALNLVYCAVAIGAVITALRIFDKLLGYDFATMWKEITDENNTAMAQYLGMRFLGCCWIVGSVFS